MQNLSAIAFAWLVILIGGCQSRWVTLEGSPIVESEFQQARTICQVDEKLDRLEQAEAERNKGLQQAKSNEANMLVKDNFDLQKRAILTEIDTCMRLQGYRKSG